MGRTEISQGLAPPAIRKDVRAKQARHIVNKVIPALLASSARARKGADGSELITDPGNFNVTSNADQRERGKEEDGSENAKYIKRKGQGRRKAKGGVNDNGEEVLVRGGHEKEAKAKRGGKRRNSSIDEGISQLGIQPTLAPDPPKRTIRIVTTDTLTAAQMLMATPKYTRKGPNICVLNMASPLRPGGGVLTGATSQEEFLCARTTLLPSLKENFYRLPEYGGIFTRDVLVFRNALPLSASAGELNPTERYYVDVVSAGMLRFPEVEGSEEGPKTLSKKDKAIVERKMRAVLCIAASHNVKKLILGAWGCGAYGNPVHDIAELWHKVLNEESSGGKKGKTTDPVQTWTGIEEIIFAIPNPPMAQDFAHAFSPTIPVEAGPGGPVEDEQDEETDTVAEELKAKIEEMEGQLGSVWNSDLKQRMGTILDGLRAQLQERKREDGGEDQEGNDSDDTEDSENVVDGVDGDVRNDEIDEEEEEEEEEEDDDDDDDDDDDEETDQEDSDNSNHNGGLKLPPTK